MIKPKGFMDFLKEDSSLLEKKTYEELTKLPPDNDYTVEEAYRGYKRVLEELNK